MKRPAIQKGLDLPKNVLVTICIPVYNEEAQIDEVVRNALSQTYRPLEIVILDNASTDRTFELCERWAQMHPEIRLHRHESNIGGWANLQIGLRLARGEFFCWLAADDRKSHNFIESNVTFLGANPGFVGVTGKEYFGDEIRTFDLSGETRIERIREFRTYCWRSNGLFYGLFRLSALETFPPQRPIFGADWAVLFWSLAAGRIGRNTDTSIVIGTGGLSNSANRYSFFRKKLAFWFKPFGDLEKQTLGWDFWFPEERRALKRSFAKLNLRAAVDQFRFEVRSSVAKGK